MHNLEHGYTILWYDETIADDDATRWTSCGAIADKLAGTSNLRTKFKAVPWTSEDEDGKKFPEGQHVAFTHWSVGGAGQASDADKPGGRLAVLLDAERRGAQRLHAGVPLHRLPRAGALTPPARP